MFQRELTNQLIEMAKRYPVITLLGPRQSGKTTLVRKVFSQMAYVNLEAPDILQLAQDDPRGFLDQYPDGCILDEIQNYPELLSYIQTIVDQKDEEGMYILTGSHQLALHENVAQSLAGRTAMLTLMPLSLSELQAANFNYTLEQQFIYGGYPRIYNKSIDPKDYFRDYIRTYLEKDVRQIINIKDLTSFQRLMQLCAARVGKMFDYTSMANELGIARNTVKEWISVLEASFVLFRLPPYFENFGKRIIKSPKLYFWDTGLVCYLLGLDSTQLMLNHPIRGELFENLMIVELMKAKMHHGVEPRFYYFRDSNQNEVDLIIAQAGKLIAVEFKSGKTFHPHFLKGLQYFNDIAHNKISQLLLVYSGDQEQIIHENQLLHYQNLVTFLEQHT